MLGLGFLRRTPIRTFIVYPLITIVWELILNRGALKFEPLFLPFMLWGYLQYRLCGLYRIKHGGGGPGEAVAPEQLVTSGPYAFARNPMYLGHIIFLTGLTLTLKSVLAALITLVTACWFHWRVVRDEKRLGDRFGQPYIEYTSRVKRWLPGLF